MGLVEDDGDLLDPAIVVADPVLPLDACRLRESRLLYDTVMTVKLMSWSTVASGLFL